MYGTDLAYVHDAGFTALAEAAAREVLTHVPSGVALDVGCGSGTLAEALADAGLEVHGMDVSPAMVHLAQQRVPAGQFAVGDVRQAALPPADVVTAVGEVLAYACHDAASLRAVLARIHAALPTGGWLFFDLPTPGRAPEPTHAALKGADWRVEATAIEDGDFLVRTIDTWRTLDGVERQHRETHRLRLFSPTEVLAMLHDCGFVADDVAGYDDFGFQEGWDAFFCQRTT